MRTRRWGKALGIAAMGMALASSIGCQTWYGGMTLPTGHYLDHRPQYFPPDPEFPLEKELATQQGQAALIDNAGRPGVAPGAGPVQPR